MGVKGLKSFLEDKTTPIRVNIRDEVTLWKRKNENKTPIIVVDFMALVNYKTNIEENLCGGRHCNKHEEFEKLIRNLHSTGCKLVFFADLNVQLSKVREWLRRRNGEFKYYVKIYKEFENGSSRNTRAVVKKVGMRKALNSTFFGMASLVRKYGDFHYVTEHECDLELAKYATENDALAVISDDSDFLIFEGSWKLWSAQHLRENLVATQVDRDALLNICGLSRKQLPILASLLGNDHSTHRIHTLKRFHNNCDPNRHYVLGVADFVKQFPQTPLCNTELDTLMAKLYDHNRVTEAQKKWMKDSIDSYSIDYEVHTVNDPIADRLRLSPTMVYRTYKNLSAETQGINIPFHDLKRCSYDNVNLTILCVEWLRRKIGILKQNDNEKFILMVKRSFHENFKQFTETPIIPPFALPSLEQIFFDESVEMVERKWTIFAWIMSFSERAIEKMKLFPRNYLLIAATLYALAKNQLLDNKEADGILLTEHKVIANGYRPIKSHPPSILIGQFVQSAHIYNITFQQVRVSFHIAGLYDLINDVTQFDGFYYHNLMNSTIGGRFHEDFNNLRDLRDFRIYYEDLN